MMKTFRTDVVLSVVAGKVVAPFDAVHECIEHLAGGPVWTHQIPAWLRANKARLREAFPDLADFDVSALNHETFAVWHAKREHILSQEREVPVIGGLPSSPFEGLDPAKTIVVVSTEVGGQDSRPMDAADIGRAR